MNKPHNKLQNGDIIIADTAEDETVGKATEIQNVDELPIYSGLHTFACRPYKKFTPGYLGHYFNSEQYHGQIVSKAQGTKVSSISKSQLQETLISFPIHEEQLKVSNLFGSIDGLIETTRKSSLQLKALKKSMLVKMFPQDGASVPEIRFEGFTGDWDKKKIEDVAPLQRGFDLPNSQMRAGKVPVVGSNGIFAFHDEAPVKGPGVMTGRSGTIGKIHFVEEDYWPHNTALWVTSFRGNKPEFIFYLYQSLKVEKFASGSGVPTLIRNDVHSSFTYVPSFSEQAAISSYFRQLDKLIELEETKLAKLTQLKTAFLSKMFV